MSHSAEIIAVGTELLLGSTANTDAQILSQGLSTLGIDVYYHTVVGDNPVRLRSALELARTRADIIITTGGLGPTYDDLTKQVICETFGRELEFHPEILENIRTYFEHSGRTMPENNRQQAQLPVDCTIFHNEVGTAPGCGFEADGVHVLMLPGPPHECRYMFDHMARPYLERLSGGVLVSHEIRITGLGESHVEELLRDLMESASNPTLASYAKPGECMLRATAKADSHEKAEAMLKPLVDVVLERLGDYVYGIDVGSLEEALITLLREKGLTLSVAESCTGGLVAKTLTDVPGASQVFRGGVVSYVNPVKQIVLGVPGPVLEEHTAVSEPVALQMAAGCRALCGSDLALAVTGVAGPGPDSDGNPEGLVFIAIDGPFGPVCHQIHRMPGRGRDAIRRNAATRCISLLIQYLKAQ